MKELLTATLLNSPLILGFIFREQMRLAHYAAPEIKGAERPLGLIAKQRLEELLPVGTVMKMQSRKTEKFGRWLAEVAWSNGTLSDFLIQQGYGLRYDNQRNEKNPSFDPKSPYPLTVDINTAR